MKGTKWIAMAALGVLMAPWTMVKAQEQAAPAAVAQVVPEDQQATQDQIDRLFEAMRVKEQMATISQVMPQVIGQQFEKQMEEMKKEHPEMATTTPEQQKAMAQVTERFLAQVMKLATGDDMVKDMGAVYRRHLTQADADGAIAFYSSPAGQHLMDLIPAVMKEFMPAEMEKIQMEIKPIMEQMNKEMQGIVKPGSGSGQ